MMRQIGVVGSGSWGTTLAKILGENGWPTRVWSYEEKVAEEINSRHTNERYVPGAVLAPNVEATTDLKQVCTTCGFMLVVVPSHVFRDVARQMGDWVNGEQVIVHCTKGIERDTFRRMSEILREETCVRKIGVLSGPNLSRELAARQPAGTLVASSYAEVVKTSQQLLHNHYFRVYGGPDMVGAEIGGAFKNIVAVAAGVVDGLQLGDNTKALLLTRGLTEMARMGASQGAEVLTFGGMAGIGDLMATCASPHSRNHQVGERLARGETLAEIEASMFMVAEGVKTTQSVQAYARYKGIELPIVQATHRILFEGQKTRDAIGELMSREATEEFTGVPLAAGR